MVHFSECSTVRQICKNETQIETRDRTVEHFPGRASMQSFSRSQTQPWAMQQPVRQVKVPLTAVGDLVGVGLV